MSTPPRPWYREPWPWLLMSGPFLVVIAGIYTTVLAVRSSDGLVADDYYKEGLAINRSLERDGAAATRGISAVAQFGAGGGVRLSLAGQAGTQRSLSLRVLHPTRSGLDQEIALHEVAPGLWEGRLAAMPSANWRLLLEAPLAGWRLTGEWKALHESVSLKPAGAGSPP